MIEYILAILSAFIISTISSIGYFGIMLLMAIESAAIPLPSEIIMPFSGYLVSQGNFSFWLVVLYGAIGNVIGSVIGYYVGFFGGRPVVEKYGKYFLIRRHEIERAEQWFKDYGQSTVFFSRLLPAVRTFISLPAGIAKMNLGKFIFYTFLGSYPWSLGLTYIGYALGGEWESVKEYFRKLDIMIVAIMVIFVVWFIWKRQKQSKVAVNN